MFELFLFLFFFLGGEELEQKSEALKLAPRIPPKSGSNEALKINGREISSLTQKGIEEIRFIFKSQITVVHNREIKKKYSYNAHFSLKLKLQQ